MDSCDIAWAAGLFEGEGTWIIRKGRYVQAGLQSTDKDVVDRFAEIVGFGSVGRVRRHPHLNRKDCWMWQSASKPDVKGMAEAFLPYLGSRRAERAREIVRVVAENPDRRARGLTRRWP